jgi:hypothetical protein
MLILRFDCPDDGDTDYDDGDNIASGASSSLLFSPLLISPVSSYIVLSFSSSRLVFLISIYTSSSFISSPNLFSYLPLSLSLSLFLSSSFAYLFVGLVLQNQLPSLVAAGLSSVNISLDTLCPDKFASITRRDKKGILTLTLTLTGSNRI